MPFGHDCEYKDWDACVKAQQNKGHKKEEAERICGDIKKKTEKKCND